MIKNESKMNQKWIKNESKMNQNDQTAATATLIYPLPIEMHHHLNSK